ncbi:D-Ala-D-Ala carboxypeptidase family metallohydrolase [Acinetobacter sichuanensis]|uniref:D-Ala-D-Ala carboxypeptidase family metallohydrolase n=1 Tax=Acinetobacter sichuanensis TaxID=2136183 RepID=A0A371YLG9_9GAMM|nr:MULTISPECIES: D-Ala-D-Ala carboxypeptidase family metallohydrolase [Acinetobacter]MDM1247869.1 peptidase M15 [Acinetobacter sp. R933-2]MDM1765205.1 peptidase M15 [Acinetobacter sp. 226-1]MDM1768710.1 peptidase M15 [Acinetobacter sp. 226-4]MDQ9022237.1 D-Ala-D-Ala carboxypeptidase family metallohydrolase [Acinetobacter sichuanensis]RFC82327.1 peptidase M15 [Acinetobacter sichuanensis]
MKDILKGLFAISIVPMMMIGCSSTPQKGQTIGTPTQSQRIYIPQEKVVIQHTVPQKVLPASYRYWLMQDDNQARAREYERFLEQNNVANIIPSFELFRTARDWQKCGRSEYMIPSREVWSNQIQTLRVFKYLVASKVLTDFEVTSVYRDLPLNQCAGGAGSSRHLFNSAIDFRIGSAYPQPQDYAYIENTKFKLCQFWSQYGQNFNMGLGLYASGQIHIDTQGYRTWGPDLSRNSSMCNF